jgi:hypothetical protein
MSLDFSTTLRAQRFLLWLSLISAGIFFFSWAWMMGFFPPPSPSLSADQVVALYSEHIIRFRIGVVLALITGAFMMPYSLVVSMQMARLEKGVPIWAILQLMCGLINAMYIWGPVLIWGVAAFSIDRAPELTVLLHELGWLSYITPLTCFPLNMLTIIVVCFNKDEEDRHSAFPRWLGYLTAWQAVQSFGGPIALLFKAGIFSWSGLIPFWLPLGLFGVWFGALSFTLFRALRYQRSANHAIPMEP